MCGFDLSREGESEGEKSVEVGVEETVFFVVFVGFFYLSTSRQVLYCTFPFALPSY